MRDYIFFFLNGNPCRVEGEDVFKTLAAFLRYDLCRTGTKLVCQEGDCGACTVLLGRQKDEEITYKPVNSCIIRLYQLDLLHVVTIEGLKYANNSINPLQQAMADHHGSQCGFCTPGFVVSIYDLLQKQQSIDENDLKRSATGNLCRCTGYEAIINAGQSVDPQSVIPLNKLYQHKTMIEAFSIHKNQSVRIESHERVFFQPFTLKEACDFKWEFPDSTIVAGGTDTGVLQNKREFTPAAILSLSKIPVLYDLSVKDNVLNIGACVTLAELERFTKTCLPELHNYLEFFGSPQIKNMGTLVGNIANGSPIGDSLPFLLVTNAWIDAPSCIRVRTIPMKDMYIGYKQLELKSKELISRVSIPLPSPTEILKLYKVSKRKHMDIATFTAAFLMAKSDDNIKWIRIAYGGVGPTVVRLHKTEAFMNGKPFVEDTFIEAGKIALSEISPISDARGDKTFRMQLAQNILLKFYHENIDCQVKV